MLMRTDPFRELDRALSQFLAPGSAPSAQPMSMPLDAWREGDAFFIAMDLPGVDPESIDLDVERNVLSVRAERRVLTEHDNIVRERFHGTYARQFILGENLDTDNVQASYENGVLTLRIPVAERAKPRKIAVTHHTTVTQPTTVESGDKVEISS